LFIRCKQGSFARIFDIKHSGKSHTTLEQASELKVPQVLMQIVFEQSSPVPVSLSPSQPPTIHRAAHDAWDNIQITLTTMQFTLHYFQHKPIAAEEVCNTRQNYKQINIVKNIVEKCWHMRLMYCLQPLRK